MSDPVSKLKNLVNRQKTIIQVQKANSEKIQAEKSAIRPDETDQPNPTPEPSPNVSGENDVSGS